MSLSTPHQDPHLQGRKREQWSTRLGMILSSAGAAVGLGLFWQFPYTLSNEGGGAFFLFYSFFILVFGIPLFAAELFLGHSQKKGMGGVFQSFPTLSLAGPLSVIVCVGILSYYCLIAGWGMHYLALSLIRPLHGLSLEQLTSLFGLLSHSFSLCFFWSTSFLLLSGWIVLRGIVQGIEQWSKRFMPLLFLLLLGLTLYAYTLPGWKEGVHFLFSWNNISSSSLLASLGLALFTMSLGQGMIVTYGSYSNSTKFLQTGFIIGILTIVIALLFSMMLYPFLCSFGFSPSEGENAVFKVMPAIFAQLPCSNALCFFFFLLFVLTALSSAVALIEVPTSYLIDARLLSRSQAVMITLCVGSVLNVPVLLSQTGVAFTNFNPVFGQQYIHVLGAIISDYCIPLGALCVSVVVGWHLSISSKQRALIPGFRVWIFSLRWTVTAGVCILVFQSLLGACSP